MSEIPSEKPLIRFRGFTDAWEQRKLCEMANFSKGQGYTKSDLKESGVPIILYGRLYTKYQTHIKDVDTFTDLKPNSVISKGGEVVVPSSGETAEDIAVAATIDKSGTVIGGGLNIIMPLGDLSSLFLSLVITYGTPHRELAKKAQGKSVVHLYNDDLKNIEISKPSNIEQTKISSLFLNIENLITLHQRKCEKIINLKKALLEKMFPKKGKKYPEIRFKGFSEAWKETKLELLCSKITDGSHFSPVEVKAGCLMPSVKDMNTDGFNFSSCKQISKKDFDALVKQGCKPEIGDVLVAKDGSVLKYAFEVNDVQNIVVLSSIAIFRPKKELIDGSYLAQHLVMDNFKKKVIGEYISGTGVPRIILSNFKNIPIFLPSIAEQQKIGKFLKKIDKIADLHQRELEKLQNMKKSLLEKMFVQR